MTPAAPKYDLSGGRRLVHFGENRTRLLVETIDPVNRIEIEFTKVYEATDRGRPKQLGRELTKYLGKAFSPDGRLVVGHDKETACVWDAATGERVAGPFAHPPGVRSVALSPDGKRLAVGGQNAVVRVWHVDTGRPAVSPKQREFFHPARFVCFNHTGTRLAADVFNGFRVWDVATGEPVTPEIRHEGMLNSLRFNIDDTLLVSAVQEGTAQVWDAATGKAVGPRLKHAGPVREAVFSPDGKRVATASLDGTVRLWTAATGEPVTAPLKMPGGRHPTGVAFDPAGKRLAILCGDAPGTIWDIESEMPRAALRVLYYHGIEHVYFSPDGRYVALLGPQEAVVCDAATGQEVHHVSDSGPQ
ncbi:WD40 repeat domain-containing protein [bacterium]|nr:WD40 repeat domain-containing protein [bacterium]